MTELEQIKKQAEFEVDNTYWENLRDRTQEEHILTLLNEAETCQKAGAYRSSIVMLWSASIEKIKIMALYFSPDQLKDAKHLSTKNKINSPEDLDLPDKKIIDVAEDLGLLRGTEGVVLQVIRDYIRNKCAHGAKLDLKEKDINFVQKQLLDSVFEKTDRAGITPQKIIDLVEDTKVPEDLLGAVENFSESEQYQIANELYDLRKNLPLSRMNRRENYLRREGYYSLLDSRKRDAVRKTLERIWPYLQEGVKTQVSEKAKKDILESEGTVGFLLETSLGEFSSNEKEEILQEFLGERFPKDDEDGNDVAINLSICAESFPTEASDELLQSVFAFSLTTTNYDRNKTISYFKEFIRNLSKENRAAMIDILDQKIYDAEQRWKDDIEKDWVQSKFLNGEEMTFINRYMPLFEEALQTKTMNLLSGSEFYEIPEVKAKVEEHRRSS